MTTICLAPASALGTALGGDGPKGPKDVHGKGKDLPKVWIWNYDTLDSVKLIDEVQWSGKSGYLHILCGDDDHTLKVYEDNVDDQILFGKNSFRRIVISKDLRMKKTTISVRKVNGKGDKSFGCVAFLPDGHYVVGSQGGNGYLCRGQRQRRQ